MILGIRETQASHVRPAIDWDTFRRLLGLGRMIPEEM